jgi:antitoxin HigA-1
MTIKREDVDRRIVDFSDVASGRRLPPVHPGKILRDEFLTPMRISVYEFANAINVPRSRTRASRNNGRHRHALRPLLRHVA